jgi:hypothetical protein
VGVVAADRNGLFGFAFVIVKGAKKSKITNKTLGFLLIL